MQGLGENILSNEKNMAELADQVSEEQDWALVKYLREKVSEVNFGEIADVLGADWTEQYPNKLILRYLGRQIVVAKSDILLNNEDPLDPRDQILLYNYVFSRGGKKPDGTWVGMESLPNSISKVRTLETYCEKKIAEFLSGRSPQLLSDLGAQLDGYAGPYELSLTATSSIVVPVLPMVPQFLLFWEEDSEVGIEPKTKILFDHNVLDFLDIESLVFSAERFAERLIELGKTNI
jgi:hypothetical protein